MEQTMQYGRVTTDKFEGAGGVSALGFLGIFPSREVEQNHENGTTTTTDRLGVINFGSSYGSIVVGEFNISVGIKKTQKSDE